MLVCVICVATALVAAEVWGEEATFLATLIG